MADDMPPKDAEPAMSSLLGGCLFMVVGSMIAATDTFTDNSITVSGREIGHAGYILVACGAYLVQAYLRYVGSRLAKHPFLVGGLLVLLLAVVAEPLLYRYGVLRLNKLFYFFCLALLFPVAYVTHREMCREGKSMEAQEVIRLRQEARRDPSRPNPGVGGPSDD